MIFVCMWTTSSICCILVYIVCSYIKKLSYMFISPPEYRGILIKLVLMFFQNSLHIIQLCTMNLFEFHWNTLVFEHLIAHLTLLYLWLINITYCRWRVFRWYSKIIRKSSFYKQFTTRTLLMYIYFLDCLMDHTEVQGNHMHSSMIVISSLDDLWEQGWQ